MFASNRLNKANIPYINKADGHSFSIVAKITIAYIVTGHTASETVYLVNDESVLFNFNVAEASCHTEAYSSHLNVSPIQGSIPPNSK